MIEEKILSLLEESPKGISSTELGKHLSLPLRSIQRHLQQMLIDKLIKKEGKGKATRYSIIISSKNDRFPFPLSDISQKILQRVNKASSLRTPTSYQRSFLDRYIPNQTHYLEVSDQQELHTVGKTESKIMVAGTFAKDVLHRLLIDLSWNSSRLEGNTYSLLETERLITVNEIAKAKDIKETQMILNHKKAIEFLVDSIDGVGINRHTILNVHALLSDNLLGNPSACGTLRAIPVGIGKSVYIPLAIPQLIDEHFTKLIDKANAIKDPFEQSFFLLIHLPYLQPFEDVNKRVSRLMANLPLIRNNLSPLAFIDLPQDLYISGLLAIYEFNQIELMKEIFIWSYKRSATYYAATKKSLGDPDEFHLQYHSHFHRIIKTVVKKRLDKLSADTYVKQESEEIPQNDQARFIELTERELLSLHPGNIARYQLKIREYEEWSKVW